MNEANNSGLFSAAAVAVMRREWGRKLLFLLFGKKKDNPKEFPSFISKTDEIRVENMPWVLLNQDQRYSVTEKLDGISTTFGLEKKGKGYDFIVCARNVRQADRDQECYHDSNVYWEMAEKYDIEKKLVEFAQANNIEKMYLQGETVGPSVQGNPYKLSDRQFFAFNVWIGSKRYTNEELFKWCEALNIPHVPLIFEHHQIPDNIEDMKKEVEGNSALNPDVLREGLVYRADDDPYFSFKNVGLSYLMKNGG